MKLTNERQKNYLVRYLESDCHSVKQFYKTSVSNAKLMAEKSIKEYMEKIGGYGYKIIGGNGYHFTAGWCCADNASEIIWLYVETHCHTYRIAITNL